MTHRPDDDLHIDRETWMLLRQALIMFIGVLDRILNLERTIPDKDDRLLLKRLRELQEQSHERDGSP